MSRFIQLSYAGRTINPYAGVFCDGYLVDDVDGIGTLLAVSLIANKKQAHSERKKQTAEDVFGWLFDTDTVLGTHKRDQRVKSINLEKSPWDLETAHVMCHWAIVQGLSSSLVSQAGGRYDYENNRLMADSEEKLDKLLAEFKATPSQKGIMGSRYQRIIGRSHELTGKSKTGESDVFYLYGPTLEAARKKFFPVLLAMEVPMLQQWDNHFWKLFQEEGWVTPLTGLGMAGYRISMDRDAICALISKEIAARHDFLRPPQVPAHLWI